MQLVARTRIEIKAASRQVKGARGVLVFDLVLDFLVGILGLL